MRRRKLLTAAVAGSVGSLSGCLGQLLGDSYDICESPVIMYSDLPEEARKEVDTALETGEYETDGGLLWSEITDSEPELFTGDALYRSNTETDGSTSRLWFQQDEGKQRGLAVTNKTADTVTATITVNGKTVSEPLFTETVTISSEQEKLWQQLFPGYGEYEITVETDEQSETLVWEYPPSAWSTYDDPRIRIDSTGIELIADVAMPGIPDEHDCASIWDTRE